jgi:hypothetical protein
MCARIRKCERYGTAQTTPAAGNERNLVSQL